ncbi:MAG TPA: GNAT family N-acetyltransferase [Pyrinomonadaceae bacterium]|nr:GNAT family N-acetyltransferase [Pyrinomonadaceae bacterium]HMP64592.1 GNAT family N-acetyltransferase [Pyrinomonadaceae bacterium]
MSAYEFNFRPYVSENLEDVVAIFRTNIPKYFVPAEEQELREYLTDHPEDYYLLESGGEIVAAGGIALNSDNTVSLCWGMVRNDLIGTGIGKRLTEFRLAKARERFGPVPVKISTSQHTSGFYEKLGFQMGELTPNGFGPGLDRCNMVLTTERAL